MRRLDVELPYVATLRADGYSAPKGESMPEVRWVVTKCEALIYVDIRMPGRARRSMMGRIGAIALSR
jgi:hypothetical protein